MYRNKQSDNRKIKISFTFQDLSVSLRLLTPLSGPLRQPYGCHLPFQGRLLFSFRLREKPLLKGNSPVRGNVCRADKRVPVSGGKGGFCEAKDGEVHKKERR